MLHHPRGLTSYVSLFYLATALLLLSSCSAGAFGTIKFKDAPKQVDFRPELRQRLSTPGDPSLMLVVPSAVLNRARVDERDDTELFAVVERVFFTAGYPLRGERLFDVVADGAAGYSELHKGVNTDYLVELVGIGYPQFSTNKYTDRRGRERTIPGKIEMIGARVNFRLSDVATNAVVGLASYTFVPCTDGCERVIAPTGQIYQSAPITSLTSSKKPVAYEVEYGYSDEEIVRLATE